MPFYGERPPVELSRGYRATRSGDWFVTTTARFEVDDPPPIVEEFYASHGLRPVRSEHRHGPAGDPGWKHLSTGSSSEPQAGDRHHVQVYVQRMPGDRQTMVRIQESWAPEAAP